jgi:hypothetical protein
MDFGQSPLSVEQPINTLARIDTHGATVKDGIFRGHRGIEGKPGGQVFDGTIDPDGTTRIFAKGLSGDTKSDPFHRPTGTEFRYTIAGKLEGSHGKASRVDRDCDVSFVKR